MEINLKNKKEGKEKGGAPDKEKKKELFRQANGFESKTTLPQEGKENEITFILYGIRWMKILKKVFDIKTCTRLLTAKS